MQGKLWFLVAAVALTSFSLTACLAKPMEAPTLEEAVKSPSVVICEYVGYDKDGEKSYGKGCVAEYKVTTILKGVKLSEKIKVRYMFHDCSYCIEPEGWKFSEDKLPKAGSKWILFLQPGDKPADPYDTYRGTGGRLSATDDNLKKVNDLLK